MSDPQEPDDKGKVIQLYPQRQTATEVLDLAYETIEESAEVPDKEIETLLVIGITKDRENFHILSNGVRLVDKYTLVGLLNSWVAEMSIAAGWKD